MSEGCTFNMGTWDKVVTCKIITDAGQTYCPRHILIAEQRRLDGIAKEDRKIKAALEKSRQKVKAKRRAAGI